MKRNVAKLVEKTISIYVLIRMVSKNRKHTLTTQSQSIVKPFSTDRAELALEVSRF